VVLSCRLAGSEFSVLACGAQCGCTFDSVVFMPLSFSSFCWGRHDGLGGGFVSSCFCYLLFGTRVYQVRLLPAPFVVPQPLF